MTDKTTAEAAVKRYSDAYRSSRITKETGDAIKVLAVIIAAFFCIVSVSTVPDASGAVILLFISAFLGVVGYGAGLIVAALGQIMRAAVDSAVHSSPFLSDRDRASVMSLEPQQAWNTIGIGSAVSMSQTQAPPADVQAYDAQIKSLMKEIRSDDGSMPDTVSPLAVLFAEREASSRNEPAARRRTGRPVRRRWN